MMRTAAALCMMATSAVAMPISGQVGLTRSVEMSSDFALTNRGGLETALAAVMEERFGSPTVATVDEGSSPARRLQAATTLSITCE